MTRNSNDALIMGIVACFLAISLFFPSSIHGCDMSAFVQSDFAARCQLLLDLCDKATISRRVSHPDMAKHAGNLSREWVRFFLAHGMAATRPPSLDFIASTTWEAAINELGMSIAATTRGEIDFDNYELMRFKISLLKDSERLATVQKVLNASKTSDIASSSVQWLEREFIGPGAVIAEHLQSNQTLLARLESSASFHLSTAERIDKLTASESAEIVAAFAENLKNAARADRQFWQHLFFCD